jgi:DNA polymerase-2
MLSHESRIHDDKLAFFSSERTLLKKFISDFRDIDPDIIIGWHVIGFDLKFLEDKCLKLGIPFLLGRDSNEVRVEEKKGSGFFARINGRVVIDGPPAFRSAFYQFKNFRLDTVASELLGTGKDIASDGGKVSEIERRFKEDKVALAKYNLLDCVLVTKLYNKVSMIDFLVQRVKVSGLLLDRLGISTAALDHVLLPKLHRKGVVAPNSGEMDRDENSSGGMVIEPKVGLHQDVAVFDFKSLYPSIIRTFKIDPYSRIMASNNRISTPVGVDFSKTDHLLPDIIENLLNLRQLAKDNNNRSLNLAIKILMNSFYGLMGSFRCRFYHADLPKAITETGHWLLKQTIGFFENRNMEVLYGDTDSIFVKLNNSSDKNAVDLAVEINQFLARIIQDEFKLESHLELEFEKTYSKIYFSSIRGSDLGAKKKYVGLSSGEMVFTGMEYVRSDWTDLAKNFQYQLFEIFFMGGSLEQYIKEYIEKLKNGEFDDLLNITKKLSKDPKEYVKNIPPHVKAALLVDHRGPYRLKEVTYRMTVKGPVPIQNSPVGIDYEYYIEKQIQPLADQVLGSMGKSFESIALGDQLTLF